jgi:hypothetical protein
MFKVKILVILCLANTLFAQISVDDQARFEIRKTNVLAKKSDKSIDENYIYEVVDDRFAGVVPKTKKISFSNYDRFEILSKTRRRVALNDKNMRAAALRDVKDLLPKEVGDSCAVTAVNLEYEQKDNGNPRVVASSVLLHRKIDGISVRGNSFINMEYDSDGNLTRFDMRWPKYQKRTVRSRLSVNEIQKSHNELLNQRVEIVNKDIEESKVAVKGKIKKSYRTLSSIKGSMGEEYLIPSVTYVGSFNGNDDDNEIPIVIDVPMDESIIPQEKAIASKW